MSVGLGLTPSLQGRHEWYRELVVLVFRKYFIAFWVLVAWLQNASRKLYSELSIDMAGTSRAKASP